MKPDFGSLLFFYGIFFLVIIFILIGLLRWIFRINHIVDRLDKISVLLEGKPKEDVPKLTQGIDNQSK